MSRLKAVKAASAVSLMIGVGIISVAATGEVTTAMAPIVLLGFLLSIGGFIGFVACRLFE